MNCNCKLTHVMHKLHVVAQLTLIGIGTPVRAAHIVMSNATGSVNHGIAVGPLYGKVSRVDDVPLTVRLPKTN
jgi:hypothetical protein